MNENASKKKILFNKSTLLSLKAELLKKQEEVNEKKHLPQNKPENFKPAIAKPDKADKPEKKNLKQNLQNLKQVDADDLQENRKIKSALEKKAELYEHLSDGAGSSELAGRFLVDFNTKKRMEPPRLEPSLEADVSQETVVDEDDGDWVEFTDCLGRTRKCLKTDVELYKKRDLELMRAMSRENAGPSQDDETKSTSSGVEQTLLQQKTKDYLQSLRDKWEARERDLLAADRDIHYQDLLFDEARIHGVGYYAFSTEEAERAKQMAELNRLREETVRAQKDAEESRKRRDELIAARVAAARARRRMRAGLPPEDPEESKKEFTDCLLQLLTQQKNEADAKAKEEEKRKREEKEKERQKIREAYVREWDLGKDGVEDPKKFREMTQEEYVEQQRSKRIDEFAPPQERSTSSKAESCFDNKGNVDNSAKKTWNDVRPISSTPAPPDIDELPQNKGLFFSSKQIKYKNFVKPQEPVPIENELSDEESEIRKPSKRKPGSSSAEIAPPPTYDYYGPTPKHTKSEKPFKSDIREAFAQGSKSLETKESKRNISKDYDFIL